MSHLEVLMQKGDIQGPPYVMPDDVELTFLRKFIERHNASIPHNPRLRHLGPSAQPPHIEESMEMTTPELSDPGYPHPTLVDQMARLQPGMQDFLSIHLDIVNQEIRRPENTSSVSSPNYAHSPGTSHRPHLIRPPSSPSTATYEQLIQEARASGQRIVDTSYGMAARSDCAARSIPAGRQSHTIPSAITDTRHVPAVYRMSGSRSSCKARGSPCRATS